MRSRLLRIWWAIIGRQQEHLSCRWVLESALQQRDAARLVRDELDRERKALIGVVQQLGRRVDELERQMTDAK